MKTLNLQAALVTALSSLTLLAGCADNGSDDLFLYESASALQFTGVYYYDQSTQCTVGGRTMHCCPEGSAMVGFHAAANLLKCGPLNFSTNVRFKDTGTQRNNMHACPLGSLMVGLHVSDNLLACQYPASAVAVERVDGIPTTVDTYPMHVCPVTSALSGIQVSANRFSCSQ